jgi:hypothetical protein
VRLRGRRRAMAGEQGEQEQASHDGHNVWQRRTTYGMSVGHAFAMQMESQPSIPHG